ncbi:MAG: pyridoxal-phosphate dependent enzyme [Sporolactobacillus sp.]
MPTKVLPSLQDVWKARKSILPFVSRTPLLLSAPLSHQTGASIYLKCEHLHPSGAFKWRGAVNSIAQLTKEQLKQGVTTYSTGNHGIAVSMAAAKFGTKAVICVSNHIPQAKMDFIRSLGAELKIVGSSQDEAESYCNHLRETDGLTIVPPFDHPAVISGQGTIALEILEELPDVNCVVAGLSGGGLLSGISLVMKSSNKEIRTIGVSMENGAVMHESLNCGHIMQLKEQPTFADSLLGGLGETNQYTFSLINKYLDRSILIPEQTIAKGMAYIYQNHHMIVEGAAGITVGAILDGFIKVKKGTNIVLILSGCNVDLKAHSLAIQPYLKESLIL